MPDPLTTGILLKLDVTVWTGSAALSAPDLGLDPGTIAAHYTLGRKRLVPKAALDPIVTIVRQARYALESLSHALPDGSRFVLEAATPEVEAQLTRARERFGAAVEAFFAAFPRWRAEMAPEWDAAARAAWETAGCPGEAAPFVAAFLARVEAAYPTTEALRRKFDFFWWAYTLRLAGGDRVELAGVADAERARRAADAAYRAEVEARVASALERNLAGFRAQVAEACRTVLAHIASDRPVREGALARLRRTIRRFRALNFVEDDALESQLAAFERACLEGLDPAAVSQAPDLRATLAAGLQAVVEAATAELPRSALTGRALRRFDVEADAEAGEPAPVSGAPESPAAA
jgi:Protein of unknown function (DUF3150)